MMTMISGMWWWWMYQPMMAAQAAQGADDSVSGKVVVAIIGAICTGVAGILAHKHGEKSAREAHVKPLPLPVSLVEKLATKEQLDEVEQQLDGRIGKVESALTEERRVAREAQSNVHRRIDKVAESLAEVRGELRQLNANLARLIERKMSGE